MALHKPVWFKNTENQKQFAQIQLLNRGTLDVATFAYNCMSR